VFEIGGNWTAALNLIEDLRNLRKSAQMFSFCCSCCCQCKASGVVWGNLKQQQTEGSIDEGYERGEQS
jgi:hypothetical protein